MQEKKNKNKNKNKLIVYNPYNIIRSKSVILLITRGIFILKDFPINIFAGTVISQRSTVYFFIFTLEIGIVYK